MILEAHVGKGKRDNTRDVQVLAPKRCLRG